MTRQKIHLLLLIVLALQLGACVTRQGTGAMVGGTYGGFAGAILDQRNPWRGGVVGATLGALVGATIADISAQGAREAVTVGRPVEYRTEDRRAQYYAEPLGYDEVQHCRRVREKIYVDGHLVRKRIVLYCDKPVPEPPPRYRYDRHHDRYDYDDD